MRVPTVSPNGFLTLAILLPAIAGLSAAGPTQQAQRRADAVSASAQRAGSDAPQAVTLSYIPTGAPRSVTIAGTFNGWNRSATPLTPRPSSLAWTVTLNLSPGIYQYRFVVNGSRWITPQDALRVNDGSGNINALLVVAPPEFARRAGRLGDGQITASGVMHRASPSAPPSTARTVHYVVRADRGHFQLTLRTRHDDLERCRLLTPGGPAGTGRTAMTRYASDALFDYWRAEAPVLPEQRTVQYAFLLQDGPTELLYDGSDFVASPAHSIHWFQVSPMDFPPFETPDWARDAIFYQIFPDRFANGDRANDTPDVAPWDASPTSSNRMGGDLNGILDHVEYLRDLGINGIYLNPIFASRSNHGYDTTDYKRVDPRFGTTAELKSLTARAHLHHWHVILDGVFNHTGVDFEPFKSVLHDGPNSPYRAWYHLHGFPVRVRQGNYEGWNGSPWMPKLNTSNPATRDFLLDVSTYWIREANIDGWRLDAASEVSHDFWKAFRRTVKAAKPNALLVGEIWPEAQDWLQGDEMDSVTNYRWRSAALDFFVFDKTAPTRFDAALAQIRSDYPAPATAVMFNILGSHDVERIRTLCSSKWDRERQAVAFQMTYPGTPCIYYGDEVGMDGGRDPNNRRAIPWDRERWDKTTYAFYKSAIALRREHPVLRRGDYQTMAADDKTGVYAYLRSYGNERALVVFNRSDGDQKALIPIAKAGSLPYHTWLDGGSKPERQGDNLVVSLPKRGFVVLGH